MRKFLFKIGIAGLFTFLGYLVVILASDIEWFSKLTKIEIPIFRGGNGHQWTRLREADTTKNVDILILGSSLAQSIDVRRFDQFNLRAFNLASGSQSPLQTSFLLEKYLEQFNPKWVIWDFHPFTFTNYGIESIVDITSNCDDCSNLLPMIAQTRSVYSFNTYVKRMLHKPFEDPTFREPLETELTTYIKGGYMETFFKTPDHEITMDEFHYEGLDLQKHTFESELFMLKREGIKVILVYSPKYHAYNNSFKNSQEWFDYALNLKSQNLIEDFLDFNTLIPGFESNTFYFYDIGHLTVKGAATYNEVLFKILRTRFSKELDIN
ncbi:hypothetical protein V8V91_05160 [Algoriphagus halophilus]|uniref:hypothetical protein n=1 Tax=Algoriphagus halophilus TaxID=226505 RepID=UPI00358FC81B